jgi:hypothetical protein
MAVSKKELKNLECKYIVGDTFTNTDGFFIVSNVKTRDEANKLLKEPLYTLSRFPEHIIKNDKVVLELKPFEAYESEIERQLTFNWSKVD